MYDYVFKHLMSNEKLAKGVLSIILDKEVVQLRPVPREVYAGQALAQTEKEPTGAVQEPAATYTPLPIITIYILG